MQPLKNLERRVVVHDDGNASQFRPASRAARRYGVPGIALLYTLMISGCGNADAVLTPQAAPTPPIPTYVYTGIQTYTGNELAEYEPRGTTPIRTFPGSAVASVALDQAGTLYVADSAHVREYSPKTHRLERTLSGFLNITDLRFDARGNLYVVSAGDYTVDEQPPTDIPATLQEFAPGALKPTRIITTDQPSSDDFRCVAIDKSGTLYAGGENGDVNIIPPGALHPQRTLPGTPFTAALAFDTIGNLYVSSLNTSNNSTNTLRDMIQVFAPGRSTPIRKMSAGVGYADTAHSLVLSSTNELFVANGVFGGTSYSATVTEYAAETDTPVRNFGPFIDPTSVALDSAGNVYVLDGGSYDAQGGLSEFTGNRTLIRRLPLADEAFALSTQP